MTWKFDQGPTVACITSEAVIAGRPILNVVHYEDDGSWAFLDGQSIDPTEAIVVSMSMVVELHHDVVTLADVPPGWEASRTHVIGPWHIRKTNFEEA